MRNVETDWRHETSSLLFLIAYETEVSSSGISFNSAFTENKHVSNSSGALYHQFCWFHFQNFYCMVKQLRTFTTHFKISHDWT